MASTFINLPVSQVSVGSVKITDGTDQLEVNNDGSINVAIVGGGLTNVAYNEITGVASGSLSTITSVTAGSALKLRKILASGNNIAFYEVTLNGNTIAKRYTNFGSSLSADFDFEDGISLAIGDIVLIRVRHDRGGTGNFNASIITQG